MVKTESGLAEIGEARLYYELAGEGQPLMMIHAGVADSRQWNNEFAMLAHDYQVLRYDLRGYGKSAPVLGEFSHLGDLVALLDRVGFDEPLVMMGCSMGGSLAMDFALEHPSRVKALIMAGSGPSGLSLDVPDHPKQAAAGQAYKAGDLDLLAELEAQIWFDGMGRRPDQVNQAMRKLALDMNLNALTQDAKGLGTRVPDAGIPAAERLNGIQIPVLVLVGEYDIPYMHAAADIVLEAIPSARKAVIEDAAHLLNMDQPEEFQRLVSSFLDELA